jgi:hypothetical protein
VAPDLLFVGSEMRSPTPPPVPDPWASASAIDNGWRDLIVSSAPPPIPEAPAPAAAATAPPMAMMRDLGTHEIRLKNQSMPSDFNTWQEHGAARAQELMRNEPSFSSPGDRRLWLVAGTLMTLAVLVLGLLGLLTFTGERGVENAAAAGEPVRAIEVTRPRTVIAAPGVVVTPEHAAPAAAPRAPRVESGAIVTVTRSSSSSSSSASSSSSHHHGSSSKHRHHKSRDTASALP